MSVSQRQDVWLWVRVEGVSMADARVSDLDVETQQEEMTGGELMVPDADEDPGVTSPRGVRHHDAPVVSRPRGIKPPGYQGPGVAEGDTGTSEDTHRL